jgi:hypothetical protein
MFRISRPHGGSTIRLIEKESPIATRAAGTVTVRGASVLQMRDVIFEAIPGMGRAGVRGTSADRVEARETSADRAGDNLPTGVPRRDLGRGRADDPIPRQPCKASSLISPDPDPGPGPGTDPVVEMLP